MSRILGIDPGSRRTGVGLLVASEGRLRHLAHRVVETRDEEFPARLKDIFDGVGAAIAEYQPQEAAIETVFLSKNPQSALKLGQARGAAICACVNAGLAVHEYAPRQIKNAVVGSGSADKTQVQYMVGLLLGLQEALQADAADALAVAITHAHLRESAGRLGLPLRLFRR